MELDKEQQLAKKQVLDWLDNRKGQQVFSIFGAGQGLGRPPWQAASPTR
jgi:hypothetical protein